MFVLEILASGYVVAPARDFLEFARVELHAIVVWHFAVVDDSYGGLDRHVERRQLRLVATTSMMLMSSLCSASLHLLTVR